MAGGGGEGGPPVFDLLAPAGGEGEIKKRQLAAGVLYPVGGGGSTALVVAVLAVVGIVSIAGFFFRRWSRVRT